MTHEETIESCGLRVVVEGLGPGWRALLFVVVHLAGPVHWAISWLLWHAGARE